MRQKEMFKRQRKRIRDTGISRTIDLSIHLLITKIKDYFGYLYAYLYSSLVLKKRIHVIGDSHTWVFKRTRYFLVHYIGPATIFNLLSENGSNQSKRKLLRAIKEIKPGDMAVLVFGEIDCRIHIYYQYEKNNHACSMSEIIDRTLTKYCQLFEELDSRQIRYLVYSIPPAVSQGNIYNYPYYAERETRQQIACEFNDKLSLICYRKNIPFIDIFSRVRDADRFINPYFASTDSAHLNSMVTPLIIDWFKVHSLI